MKTFEEFWPYYVGEHRNKLNRTLHVVGTSLAIFFLTWAVTSGRFMFVIVALLFGYGFAWIGHFFVEKNKPATFKHPLWSLVGDFKMLALVLTGRMEAENCSTSVHPPEE